MPIEHIVTICLKAIENGESVESCLVRFPDHAEELAPLLQLALALRTSPRPRLSAQAFRAGRSAVAAAAQTAQMNRHRFPTHDATQLRIQNNGSINGINHGGGHGGIYTNGTGQEPHERPLRRHFPFPTHSRQRQHTAASSLPTTTYHATDIAAQDTMSQGQRRTFQYKRRRFSGVLYALAALLLLAIISTTILQRTMSSKPGMPLYTMRSLALEAQGFLINAGGDGAVWYGNQAMQRLSQLERYTTATDQEAKSNRQLVAETLALEIHDNLQRALAAAAQLPIDRQQQLYATWLDDLTARRITLAAMTGNATVLALLDRSIAEVSVAAENLNILEVTPPVATPPADTIGDEDGVGVSVTTSPTSGREASTNKGSQDETDANGETLEALDDDTALRANDTLQSAQSTSTAELLGAIQASTTEQHPTRVLRATPLPTAQIDAAAERTTRLVLPPTATATAIVVNTPTPAQIMTGLMPRQSSDEDDSQESEHSTENESTAENSGQNDTRPSDESGSDASRSGDEGRSRESGTNPPPVLEESQNNSDSDVIAIPDKTGTAVSQPSSASATPLPTATVTPTTTVLSQPNATATISPVITSAIQPTTGSTPTATATPPLVTNTPGSTPDDDNEPATPPSTPIPASTSTVAATPVATLAWPIVATATWTPLPRRTSTSQPMDPVAETPVATDNISVTPNDPDENVKIVATATPVPASSQSTTVAPTLASTRPAITATVEEQTTENYLEP